MFSYFDILTIPLILHLGSLLSISLLESIYVLDLHHKVSFQLCYDMCYYIYLAVRKFLFGRSVSCANEMFKHCQDIVFRSSFNKRCKKINFFIKNFFSKCELIRRKLRIWLYFLKKLLLENFYFFVQ